MDAEDRAVDDGRLELSNTEGNVTGTPPNTADEERLEFNSTEGNVTETLPNTRSKSGGNGVPDVEESSSESTNPHDEAVGGEATDAGPNAESPEEGKETCSSGNSEWRDEEPPKLQVNHEALKHIATYFLPGNHGKCTEVLTLTKGAYHEIRELLFEDGWSCLGRLTRNRKEALGVLESETATVDYVRRHTTIPVPEIFFVNFNPDHVVGAAFVLMEKLPGRHLYKTWEELRPAHMYAVIEQIADVMAQLCKTNFNSIGSLDVNGEIGPLQSLTYSHEERGRGPFQNTTDYMTSFLHPVERRREPIMQLYEQIEPLLVNFMNQNGNDPILQAPYRLTHADFDGQNMLFEQPDPDQPPRLTGIIDWDQSHSGPLYYLCNYPIFIRDCDMPVYRDQYVRNLCLRQSLVFYLSRHFPRGSQERRDVQECFRQKSYSLNGFENIFMGAHWRPELELGVVESYAKSYNPDPNSSRDYFPYGGKIDWEPDSELESEGEDSEENPEEDPVEHRVERSEHGQEQDAER
ncbi:uncharacterized protein RCC_01882 [Ramularia collo-cygni]|uniref:Aminoglycoside phosphotransferase domain-containing protein n=1 Tax=Ramularia collo-cygni TaxID=112498 RepID=A0A2D3UM48_9PEZI|nr:uncharacterized protein RCC_01882 [Ramularia collo-cygni]CZT16042.1 uncharacterized protein RCC_01882 [Ramularia collo-cygni]